MGIQERDLQRDPAGVERKLLTGQEQANLSNLREKMQLNNVQAMLVSDFTAVRSFTGFEGAEGPEEREALLLVTLDPKNTRIFTRQLYYPQIPEGVIAGDFSELPDTLASLQDLTTLGIEADNLTVEEEISLGGLPTKHIALDEFRQPYVSDLHEIAPRSETLTHAQIERQEKLRAMLLGENVGGMLVSEKSAVRYYTGFTHEAMVLVTPGQTYIYTNPEYFGMVPDGLIARDISNFAADARDVLQERGSSQLGIESYHLTVEKNNQLMNAGLETKSLQLVREQRAVKSPEEIRMLQEACRQTDEALEFIRPFLRKGVTEREIAARLEGFMRGRGYVTAFTTIVAFGVGTSEPHHLTGDTKLEAEMPITIDLGFEKVDATSVEDDLSSTLPSDITRSYWYGDNPPEEFERMYRTVLEANNAVIRYLQEHTQDIADGKITGKMVDQVARNIILSQGYVNEDFPHGTGHSVNSYQVHANPYMTQRRDDLLQFANVVTDEPGVYRKIGVRVEDDVCLTPEGAMVLSSSPKDYESVIIHPQ